MASSAACECGAEQTVDHVVLQCPIHRPHGMHVLTVLDDESMEWLLNTWPEIQCGLLHLLSQFFKPLLGRNEMKVQMNSSCCTKRNKTQQKLYLKKLFKIKNCTC